MKTKKTSGVINFFKFDYKKIILGGIGLYGTAYIINLMYFFLMQQAGLLMGDKNITIMKEVATGNTNNIGELVSRTFNQGIFFGAVTIATIFILLIAVIFDEKLLLKRVSSWKESLALGLSWALVFVILENILMSIAIRTQVFADGSYSGYSLGLTTLNFYYYSYWYFVLILFLPVLVISLRKRAGK